MGAPRKVKAVAALVLGAITLFAAHGAVAQQRWPNWRNHASDYDINRLELLDQWREKAIEEVRTYNDARGDFNAVRDALTAEGRAVPLNALTGNWKCRQMKLGGLTAYITYGWFNCRIRMIGGGPFLEKLGGSQRMQGFLYPDNTGGWVYLGSQYTSSEKPTRYSGRAASIGAPATPNDQIGLLTGIGRNRLRIEIPGPVEESTFDILELAR